MMRSLVALVSTLALLAGCAQAHVHFTSTVGVAGSSNIYYVQVPHGCLENTYNTTALEIAVPSTIPSVTPQFLAPYTTTVRTQAASPVDCGYAADSTATCYLTIVRWSGVTIPLYQYAVFGLQMTLPNKANTTYYFDAVQTCFNNTVQYYNSTNGDGPNGSNIFSAPRLTTPATTTSTM